MPEAADPVTTRPLARCLKPWPVAAMILLMAAGIVFLIAGNWNIWANEPAVQKTDDAYTLRAGQDLFSTTVTLFLSGSTNIQLSAKQEQ